MRDLMTPDLIALPEDTPLHVACLLLLREQIGGAPVVDDQGALVGVLTERSARPRGGAPKAGAEVLAEAIPL
ncbi:MAG: CBS domain-containing protein [Egibacteraceae bacterium]